MSSHEEDSSSERGTAAFSTAFPNSLAVQIGWQCALSRTLEVAAVAEGAVGGAVRRKVAVGGREEPDFVAFH